MRQCWGRSGRAAAGGYDDIFEAARAIGKVKNVCYMPVPENAAIYDRLFGNIGNFMIISVGAENDIMKRLKQLKKEL